MAGLVVMVVVVAEKHGENEILHYWVVLDGVVMDGHER